MQKGTQEIKTNCQRYLENIYCLTDFFQDDIREELSEDQGLKAAVMADETILKKFLENKDTRAPHLPNLDGLFGGVACQRITDKSIITKASFILKSRNLENLTIRGDEDNQYNKDIHHNTYLEERIYKWDVCEIPQLCEFQMNEHQPGKIKPLPCIFYSWTGH